MEAQTDWKQEPDDQSERLYSLTLALVQTEVGLTKDEIFTSIRGYRLDLEKAGGFHGDLSALNKKFDRDKEKLRDLGVQIVPAANSNEGDSDYRYRISRDIFEWPAGTSLSAKQLQLLELAASLWDRASLSPEATNAITRLRAISEPGDSSFSSGIAPRINTIEPSFSPLKKAIEEGVRVSFGYRRADGIEGTRIVEPWQLTYVSGVWMLLGFDLERSAPRNFLLKRIHSKVTRTKEEIIKPTHAQIDDAKAELAKVFDSNRAVIKVRPGTTAAMHFETHKNPSGQVQLNFYIPSGRRAYGIWQFGPSNRTHRVSRSHKENT
jgi:proteasome accessory factor B